MLLVGKEDRREGRDSSWLVTYFKHMLMTNNNNNEDIRHKLLSTICPSGLVSRGHLYMEAWVLSEQNRNNRKLGGHTSKKHDCQGSLSHYFSLHDLSLQTRKTLAHRTHGEFSLAPSEALRGGLFLDIIPCWSPMCSEYNVNCVGVWVLL